jgi:hypothetical protein
MTLFHLSLIILGGLSLLAALIVISAAILAGKSEARRKKTAKERMAESLGYGASVNEEQTPIHRKAD